MYIAAFIYKPGQRDEEFHRLSALIDEIAISLPGFVGAQSWTSADQALINASYYWEDEASIQAFARHPRHLEAKRQYRRWYAGYQVVISKVERTYGDGAIAQLLSNDRQGQVRRA
ncbi:antibiotic biosynthesis monooxygenase family protein [Pseudomonas protegens]|uniref:antibiotic biosynthesis monooxygenase family protein n=1 Tax=Pseudomonas protegens TaxID=380021 RepID=UPI000F4BE78E|nr:antibiotic biosynthesis monooxygenase [Pseudomonas protegens]MDP9519402.1 antibiotic biosynthesis monooxygenase [Pseudomonas protegens]ROL79169.1 antibiotic biosynthesis monooxygenase [Pseudomonas protegens]